MSLFESGTYLAPQLTEQQEAQRGTDPVLRKGYQEMAAMGEVLRVQAEGAEAVEEEHTSMPT